MKIARVIWHDAHDQSETWMDITEIDGDPCVVTSVGYLIEASKPAHIVLAQSVTDQTTIDNVVAIPLGMVQSIEELS